MAFDVKYYVQAEDEIKQRRQANAKQLELRRLEISQRFAEYKQLREIMASTGAKLAQLILERKNSDVQKERIDMIQAENVAASARIKELLMSAGYPPNYLESIYTCEICRDTGIADSSRCECYRNAVRRLAAKGINSTSPLVLTGFETFEVELYPEIYKLNEGESLPAREVMRHNFDYCKNYAENFHLPGFGLLLTGRTGLGKTHLSLAIAGKVLEQGYNAIYGSALDFFRKVEDEHFGREKGNTMDSLQSAELLVLDDIGTEFTSSFYASVFYNLINSRMNYGNPTVISTNLSMEELKERYGERLVSRFVSMKILKFYGNDIRQIKRFGSSP
ncbi:MAG: ATP-binding protein [Oscillospiraceae bacterium]|nr:ATP-binding protein [Oscillospiraceae bacterium]